MTELITVEDLITRLEGYIAMSPFGYAVGQATLQEIVAVLKAQQLVITNLREKLEVIETTECLHD